MKTFKVSWEIEVDADTPLKAAWQALTMMRDPDSTATVFEVDGQKVDLQSEDAAPSLTTSQREAIERLARRFCDGEMYMDRLGEVIAVITGEYPPDSAWEQWPDEASDRNVALGVRQALATACLLEMAEAAVAEKAKQECGPPPPGG